MYAVSNAFRAALKRPERTDKITGTIQLTNGETINFTDADIKSGSVKIDNQCVNGEALEFGAVYAGQLAFTLQTDVNRYALYDGIVNLTYALQLETGEFEAVPLGVYTITDATRNGDSVAISALDGMIKMQADYDGVSTLGKPFDVLTHLCTESGMELANAQAEIEAMPNGKETFQIDSTCNCNTWVDAVAIIAQMLACFATATRDGKLALRQFHTGADIEVIADQRFDTNVSDYISSYMGLKVTDSSGNTIESYSDAEDGLIMEINDNPLFDVGLEDHRQAMADNICAALCKIAYTPTSVSCVADPTIECGDGIMYTVGENTAFTVVTSYVWQYRGKETLKAVGKNPYITNAKNKAQKQTAGLRQSINSAKIVFEEFTNIQSHKVGSAKEERLIAMTITSVAESNAVFLAQILLEAVPATEQKVVSGNGTFDETTKDASGKETTETVTKAISFAYEDEKPCGITFLYYINGLLAEEWKPTDHFDAGKHIVSLYYPLPDMEKNTTNRLIVTAITDSGTANIDTQQIKATVIGNGLTSGKEPWDGTISIEESLGCVKVATGGAVSVTRLTDSMAHVIETPKGVPLAETFGFVPVPTNGTVGIKGLTESIAFKSVIKSWTLTNASVSYDGAYIVADETGYTMRTEWKYNSTPETIDSGAMCMVQTKTDDLETVESVVIE